MSKINNENRYNIIDQYINKLLTDMPRHELYNCALLFLIMQKSMIDNDSLETEIYAVYPELLKD